MWELEVEGEGCWCGSRERMENLKSLFEEQGYTGCTIRELFVDSDEDIIW